MSDPLNDKTAVVTIDDDCDISSDETDVPLQPSSPSTIPEPKESSLVLDDNDIQPEEHNLLPEEIPKLKLTISKSRRKSAHKPVSDVDINLDSYVYVVSGGDNKQKQPNKEPSTLPENCEIPLASKDVEFQEIQQVGIVKDTPKSQTNAIKKRRERVSKVPWTKAGEDSNPNTELMKKVAFLRACVNYMMMRLDLKPFDFKDGVSLPMLMTTYYEQRNKQRNTGNDVSRQKSEGSDSIFL